MAEAVLAQDAASISFARTRRRMAGIAGIGAALACFALVSRGRLTGALTIVDLWERLHAPLRFLLMLLVGAYYDLVLIGLLTLVFLGLVQGTRRHPAAQRSFFLLYFVLAAAVLLMNFVNIALVHYLGTPLTYQWLGYSDSLASLDARRSLLGIAAGVSAARVALAVAMALAFVLTALLFRALFLVVARYRARSILLGAAIPAALYLCLGYWYLAELHLNHSKVSNPVFVFVRSLVTEGAPSLAKMPTPVGSEDFDMAAARPAAPPAAAPGIKNVVLFVFESLAAAYVEPYGGRYPVTPNLTKYRAQAAMFESAYAHSPNTNISLVSLLTGTYPWISSRFITQEHPDIRLHSLSGELKRRDYRTAFFNSADLRFLGMDRFLAHRGFDVEQDYRTIPCETPATVAAAGAAAHRLLGEQSFEAVNDTCTADALVKWIGEAPDRPFFALLWTVMTHHPYSVGAQEVDYGVSDPSFNRYLNALRVGDAAFGRLMHALEETGLADSTLVIVLGDHGEAFGTHGQVVHASNIYEENVHIPLLLINRRLFHGETSRVVGGMADIAPTALQLLGMAEPNEWQGRSLFSPERSPRTYFFSPWADWIYGYREGDRKFIFDATTNEYAIYDLASDPGEERNLIDQSPDSRREIVERIAAWVQYQDRLVQHFTAPAPGESDEDRGIASTD